LRFAYLPSFFASLKKTPRAQRLTLFRKIKKFEAACESGQFPHGLGITHLRESFFEFRVDLSRRVIYERHQDLVRYILYGSHEDVRRFLARL